MISSNMELHALSTGRKPRVVTAMTMLKQYLFQCVRLIMNCKNVLMGLNKIGTKVMLVLPSYSVVWTLQDLIYSPSHRTVRQTSFHM